MNKQSVELSSFLDTPVTAQLASFKVAYRIAKCKKPHTIFIFLKEENHALAITFEDEVFLTHLAYLCDIYAKINQLNISLQGKDTHLWQLHDKITAFKRKLVLWKTNLLINNEECDSFTILKSHFRSQSGNPSLGFSDKCDIKGVMCSHLDALILHLRSILKTWRSTTG